MVPASRATMGTVPKGSISINFPAHSHSVGVVPTVGFHGCKQPTSHGRRRLELRRILRTGISSLGKGQGGEWRAWSMNDDMGVHRIGWPIRGGEAHIAACPRTFDPVSRRRIRHATTDRRGSHPRTPRTRLRPEPPAAASLSSEGNDMGGTAARGCSDQRRTAGISSPRCLRPHRAHRHRTELWDQPPRCCRSSSRGRWRVSATRTRGFRASIYPLEVRGRASEPWPSLRWWNQRISGGDLLRSGEGPVQPARTDIV